MSEEFRTRATTALSDATSSDPIRMAELFPQIYDEMRGRAAALMRQERGNHTLQATAVVNEAYLKLAGSEQELSDSAHGKAIIVRAMRQILVDHSRHKRALKRGGPRVRLEFDENIDFGPTHSGVVVEELDDALVQLATLDRRRSQVAELKLLGSLTYAEIADVLEISPKTAEADWYLARAWLRTVLSE